MLVEVKKIDKVKRELKFEVGKDRVSEVLDEVYKEIGKNAKVKGFRQGKVPRHILEARHGRLAQEEAIKKIIPQVYQDGIEKEKLQPVDSPEIENVSFKDGKIFFTATLDIRPDVQVKDYKGIKLSRKSAKVTDEEIDKTLEYFKQGSGKDKDVKIDDAFARGLGYPNLAEFRSSIARQMEIDKDKQNRADVENQLIDALIKKAKVEAPESLVKKQLDRRIHDIKHRMSHQGLPQEEIDKRCHEMKKDLQDAAQKDVKLYLILDKIAEMEGMAIDENENLGAKVMEFLMKEAQWEEAKS